MNLVRDVSWNKQHTGASTVAEKAIVVTAHQLPVVAFYILRDSNSYREKGGNYIDQLNPERTIPTLMALLERMGFDVVLRNSIPDTVPSPPHHSRQAVAVAAPVNASTVE
jgi:hypothetical protein